MPRDMCPVDGHDVYPASTCAGCAGDRLITLGRTTARLIARKHTPTEPTGRDLAAGKD